MTRGLNINLFLMDGESTGRIKCTLSNWTGVAYKIPRSDLDKSKNREHLKQSGIYMLIGKNENNDKDVVYIGQAGIRKNGEGILNRLQEHTRHMNKFYFTDVVAFTTQNNSFGPTEISYLENRFTKMAIINKRYEVMNGNEPNIGNVTEEKESELEEFIDYSKIVLGVLGYKIFVPIVRNKEEVKEIVESNHNGEDLSLYLSRKLQKTGELIKATCKRTNEGFVVLKGSQIEKTEFAGILDSIKKLRETSKKLFIDGKSILQEDILFTSPSSAAMFVLGKSTNGRTAWKTKDGKTLKEIEEQDLE